MEILKNKKILFIAPIYYNYEKIIKNKMEEMGGEVTFFSEKKNGLAFGILNNINSTLIKYYQFIYYLYILNEIKNKRFTHFFLIRGYKIPKFFLKKVRIFNPHIKFIMYQWDSNKNNSYFDIVPYFDIVFSFDFKDTTDNHDLKFLQLFYTDDIKELKSPNKIVYDFFCISSFTLERFEQTKKIRDFCFENNLKAKFFCFLPFSTFIRLRIFNKLKFNESFISHKPMSRKEYLNILQSSNVIIDLSHETQTGLSMKVIEAFGSKKKIYTTNISIKSNPIYSENWVQILNLNAINIPIYSSDNKKNTEDLFIDNWIYKIFNDCN